MPTVSRSVNAQERANHIIDTLLKQDYVQVTALAIELGVAEATIRKDLSALEQQGLLRRTHGGAVHVRELTRDIALFYENRLVKNIAEKRRIGLHAAQCIQEGQVIAFSGGSTPLQIAEQIPTDISFTAITNDLNIIRVLSQCNQVELFVPGGFLRLGRDSLIGATAVAALQDFHIDQVFLTVTGLDLDVGATAGHISNVVYLRELVARSQQCVVVADHTKFQNPPQIVICGWEKIDLLITDTGLPAKIRSHLEARKLSLVIV